MYDINIKKKVLWNVVTADEGKKFKIKNFYVFTLLKKLKRSGRNMVCTAIVQ